MYYVDLPRFKVNVKEVIPPNAVLIFGIIIPDIVDEFRIHGWHSLTHTWFCSLWSCGANCQ